MAKNKIYTLSYFRKRLKDSDITSKILCDTYFDKRYWTISIDNKLRIQCTCFKYEDNGELEYYFYFTDGRQKILMDKIIKTDSMNVIISYIQTILDKQKQMGE